jgi:nitroreductase
MDVVSAINDRASASQLTEPGPGQADLEAILQAGVRGPDHGRLSPWRLTVIEGDARLELGRLMERNLRMRNPAATPAMLEQERSKALRAPTIVIAGARIVRESRIPEIEQVLAVAAGVQNMLLVSQAVGYGAMWKTGAIAYDPELKKLIGLEADDHIIGIIYIGTVKKKLPGRATDFRNYVKRL